MRFDEKANVKHSDTFFEAGKAETSRPALLSEAFDTLRLPRLRLPSLKIEERATRIGVETLYRGSPIQEIWMQDVMLAPEMSTWLLPAVLPPQERANSIVKEGDTSATSPVSVLQKLVKTSGIYALSSIALPLVSLVLAPFLTHNLSTPDYGILTILTTAIGLVAGITQLGLASAFFRAYSYDYTRRRDKRDVVAVSTFLLCLVSLPTLLIISFTAPFTAQILLGHSSLGKYIIIAGWVVLLQNLGIPGLVWLRAENKPFFYSLLSIGNLLITLITNLLLLGVFHRGVTGALIANGSGYALIAACTLPIILVRTGIKVRIDIVKNLLAFGLPLVLNFVSYWILQLSDRYLLSIFASISETAKYAVVYTLGSAMAVVVMGPFTLAWPMVMFTIAKRKDAEQVFKLVFRWFSLFLLLAAFCLSLVATVILYWLFPVTYSASAAVIPIVTLSIVFYGVYYVFMVGANVTRKTWLASVFTTVAAVTNFALNLVLIPRYGAMGAAASTLVAYIVLCCVAYVVNQRIYPIAFEIRRFIIALVIGVTLYVGSSLFARSQGTYGIMGVYIGAFIMFGSVLVVLAKVPDVSQKKRNILKNGAL